ncbi:hypothetical protein Tco_0227067 [Tanacetum coccineum]
MNVYSICYRLHFIDTRGCPPLTPSPREVGYGIINVWGDMVEDIEGRALTTLEELSQRVTDLVATLAWDTHEMYVRLEDAQDDPYNASPVNRAQQRAWSTHSVYENRRNDSLASSISSRWLWQCKSRSIKLEETTYRGTREPDNNGSNSEARQLKNSLW